VTGSRYEKARKKTTVTFTIVLDVTG